VLPTRRIDKRKLRERNRGKNKGKYEEKKRIKRGKVEKETMAPQIAGGQLQALNFSWSKQVAREV